MKKMRTLLGLALAVGAALSITAPAFASDYSFATTAPQDYYGSTSYEDVYGCQYNYGGRNAADYDVPELEYGRMSTTQTGIMEQTILPGLQGTVVRDSGSYGIGGEGSGPLTELVIDGTGGSGPAVTPTIPTVQQPIYTSVSGMARADGSIGTLSIEKHNHQTHIVPGFGAGLRPGYPAPVRFRSHRGVQRSGQHHPEILGLYVHRRPSCAIPCRQ